MGNDNSKKDQQLILKEEQIQVRAKYLSGALEHLVDKEVNFIIKNERGLLDKYSEDKRTIEDLLFKDELQIIVVNINKIKCAKKLVLFSRFLENAARGISDCRGHFETLPESAQTALINIAFASDYLDLKDVRDFGNLIKEYFKLSPSFHNTLNHQVHVDKELRDQCEYVKAQKIPSKSLAEYYVNYMGRMNKQADPRVLEKIKNNKYDTQLTPDFNQFGNFYDQQPNNGGFNLNNQNGGYQGQGGNFGGYQGQGGNFGGYQGQGGNFGGNQRQGGNFGGYQGQGGNFGGNQGQGGNFGGNQGQGGNFGGNQGQGGNFGGQRGYQGQGGNFGGQPGSNPFGGQPESNPFGGQPGSNPFGVGQPQPYKPNNNPGFGGDLPPPNQGSQPSNEFDDFARQLDELRGKK